MVIIRVLVVKGFGRKFQGNVEIEGDSLSSSHATTERDDISGMTFTAQV